jgi:hypothetical protein
VISTFFHISPEANPLMVVYGPKEPKNSKKNWVVEPSQARFLGI